jgi:hypothetical protein
MRPQVPTRGERRIRGELDHVSTVSPDTFPVMHAPIRATRVVYDSAKVLPFVRNGTFNIPRLCASSLCSCGLTSSHRLLRWERCRRAGEGAGGRELLAIWSFATTRSAEIATIPDA